MEHNRCFCGIFPRQRKDKGGNRTTKRNDENKGVLKLMQVKLEGQEKSSQPDEVVSSSFSFPVPFGIPGPPSRCRVKVMNHESPVGGNMEEVAYEGEDEHEENLSMKQGNSYNDLQALVGHSNEENDQSVEKCRQLFQTFGSDMKDDYEKELEKDSEGLEMERNGHLSDPGMDRAELWASPMLTRSCSDLGRRDMARKMTNQLPLGKSQSYEDLQRLLERVNEEVLPRIGGSPVSAITNRSADKVILKKHSSSQILPSGSRKIWWKLFLWSHRNLYRSGANKPPQISVNSAVNQQGGYSSETLEPRRFRQRNKLESPNTFTAEALENGNLENEDQGWEEFHGISGLWPQNQWVALPAESPTMTRVDEWVKGLIVQHPFQVVKDEEDSSINFQRSIERGKSPARSSCHSTSASSPDIPEESAARASFRANIPEEIAHANSVVQSLNSSSTVAHMVAIGLKVVPQLSGFWSLRFVNLSNNFIGHITPGALPKGLHTLDLSKNRISSIEGLRDLTRLRVLDLSYNKVSRIGQGLSNCTLIKELYLSGNKISDVDGLHRLLKLSVLDLSFNKITTTKSLGQLVANYNSLVALNLLGNPIQIHINDDQLRKRVCSLLPRLAFLNKQPINRLKAREVATEAIAKHALRNSSRSARRKAAGKVSQDAPTYLSLHRSIGNTTNRSRGKSKTRAHYHSSSKTKPNNIASSSR